MAILNFQKPDKVIMIDSRVENGNVPRETKRAREGRHAVYLFVFVSVLVRGAASGPLGSDPRRRRL